MSGDWDESLDDYSYPASWETEGYIMTVAFNGMKYSLRERQVPIEEFVAEPAPYRTIDEIVTEKQARMKRKLGLEGGTE